jgi:hypothetical protein
MCRRISLAVFVLIVLVLAAVGAAYQTRPLITVELGAGSAEKFLDNFHAPERGYRWSQSSSAVWLSGLGGGNLPWTVSVRLSGSRPAGLASPHVRLSVNGQVLDEFTASNEERDYAYTLPAGALGSSGDLLLQIESDTFTAPNDSRTLGVRVLRVQAAPGEGIALPAAKTFGLLLGIITAGLVGAWAVGRAEGGRELRGQEAVVPSASRRGLGTAAGLVVWAGAVATMGAVAIAIDRAEGAWWVSVVGLGAVGTAALIAAVSRTLPRSVFSRRQWRFCLLVFGLAALVRLALDTGRGYEGDVALYMALVWKTVTYGVHTAFLSINEVLPAHTPVVLNYSLWGMGVIYRQIFSPLFPPTWLNDPPILRFMLRLPALAADLLTAAIIARVTAARGARMALGTASVYLFNPALIFDGAYWGQTAALHSVWMLAAVVAAMLPAFGWAAAATALALLTKPQALATAPLVLFAAWRGGRLARFMAAAAITAVIVMLPFLLTGNMQSALEQYAQTADYHPYLSVNAHNVWWLVTGGQGWQPDSTAMLGVLSFRSAGIILFGLASILSLLVVRRDRSALYAAAAFQSFAFFMLLTQIHENHLIPMFAPLAVACALERKGWWLFGALALTTLANMALHDPNLVMALGYPADEIYGGPGLAWPRWLNAAAQTGLFAVFTVQMVRRARVRGSRPHRS